jgi:catechol 2,3-dioxygenase-like lactoylglutathione lyase family enzyme
MSQVRVNGFDHVVLNVTDVEASLTFYCDLLGLAAVRVDEWRRHEVPFPSVRVDHTTILDLLATERSGENMDHFCLVVEPADFVTLAASGTFDVVEGPAIRFGARGNGTSLYVKDPDGNVVELRYYDGPV